MSDSPVTPDKTVRTKPPSPGHADWEILYHLIAGNRVLELYEDAGRVTRAVLPATADRPVAVPVTRSVALNLISRGWLARVSGRRLTDTRITSYRLSLRGWYAARRVRPDLVAAVPPPRTP